MKITRAELDEYAQLDAEIKAVEKEMRTLAVRRKQIAAAVLEQMIAGGKAQRTRYGYSLQLVEKPGSVAWKDLFVRECGAETAAELQAEAPTKHAIVITPPKAT